MSQTRKPRKPEPWWNAGIFGWWYVTLGVGFLLLGLNQIFVGGGRWASGLRLVVAAGFFALGYSQLKGGRGR